jgi:hypothetical protein
VESPSREARAAGDVAVRFSAVLVAFRDVVPVFTDVVSAFPHEVRDLPHVVREDVAVVVAFSNAVGATRPVV